MCTNQSTFFVPCESAGQNFSCLEEASDFCGDGYDNDFDGFTDCLDPTCEGRTCADEGNPCTVDSCVAGVCDHDPLPDSLTCDDGNACTSNDECLSGVCSGPTIDCDDGNVCNGLETCNSATGCQPGSPLDCDDGDPCTQDCDPLEGCVNELKPRDVCLKAGQASLTILDRDAESRKLKWRWKDSSVGFSDPSANYALCIYAGTPSVLVTEAVLPPGPAGWSQTSTGWNYKDKAGLADGITALRLKGTWGQSGKISMKGKGSSLRDPALGNLAPFVRVQLVNNEAKCWESVFEAQDISQNESDKLKAVLR